MRLTIKYLQEKLERVEKDKSYYQQKFRELEEEKKRNEYEFRIANDARVEALYSENQKLFSIIRILAKDETLALEIKLRDKTRYSGLK